MLASTRITLRWDMRSVHRSSPALTLPQQNEESPAGILVE